MKKYFALIVLTGCMALFLGLPASDAGEIDALLQKLVDKGVLSASDAQQIRTETNEETAKAEKQKKQEVKDLVSKGAPRIVFKGDLRLRMQDEVKKGSGAIQGKTAHRLRDRMRLRLGAKAKVNDQTNVHLKLASGSSGEPQSTNQTIQDSFAKKPVWIDQAYVDYSPFEWATLIGGKMGNPLWRATDMLWDGDINPEGIALKLHNPINSDLSWFINSSIFMIDENSLGSDPWMGAVQPGIDWKITGNSKLKLAAAYYYFQHVKGSVLDYSQGGNNLKAGTSGSDGLEFNFNSISPSAQIEFDHPFDMVNVRIPYLAFFGEYHHNFDADYSNNAWSGGVALGHKKIKKFGDWQLKYINVLLGTNAWVDVFPDSDRYGGRTGVRSHEGIFTLGLSPNWEFGLDYYYSALTTANGLTNDKQQNLIQADLVWKF